MSKPIARSTSWRAAIQPSATTPPAGPLSTAFRPRKAWASVSEPLDCMIESALPGSASSRRPT